MQLRIIDKFIKNKFLFDFSKLETKYVSKRFQSSVKSYEEIPLARGIPIFGTLLELIAAGGNKQIHNYIAGKCLLQTYFNPLYDDFKKLNYILFV